MYKQGKRNPHKKQNKPYLRSQNLIVESWEPVITCGFWKQKEAYLTNNVKTQTKMQLQSYNKISGFPNVDFHLIT